MDAVGEQKLHVVERERSEVFLHARHVRFVVGTHLVLEVSAVAVEVCDVERCEQLEVRQEREDETQKPRSTKASKKRTFTSREAEKEKKPGIQSWRM